MSVTPESRLPTSMPLFRFGPGEQRTLQLLSDKAETFVDQRASSLQRLVDLKNMFENRREVLTTAVAELRDDLIGRLTPINVGEAYIKMHSELREKGVPESDFFSFFKQCVSFNIGTF